jgi:pyruvate-ferredoxin/flavodoxin oxidoreductase
MDPMNLMQGDRLPVSAFLDVECGAIIPTGTAAFEKRKIAIDVPSWIPENCIQCNQCAYVCPHSVIRPFVLDENEAENAPEGMKMLPCRARATKNTNSPLYRRRGLHGCGSCAMSARQGKGARHDAAQRDARDAEIL